MCRVCVWGGGGLGFRVNNLGYRPVDLPFYMGAIYAVGMADLGWSDNCPRIF